MKLAACFITILFGTVSASVWRRDDPIQTVTEDLTPLPPPTTSATTTSTTSIAPSDYPTWTSTNTDPYNTNIPVPGGGQDLAIRQLQVINSYLYPAQSYSIERILKVLTKISKTDYCGRNQYDWNMNAEALIHFSELACEAAFPEAENAYWIASGVYLSKSICGPLLPNQWNSTSALCVSYNFSPRYVENSQSTWFLATQTFCKGAYRKAIKFCSEEVFEDTYISQATETSLDITYSISIFYYYPPTSPGPPVPFPGPIENLNVIVDEVLRKRGLGGLGTMHTKRGNSIANRAPNARPAAGFNDWRNRV